MTIYWLVWAGMLLSGIGWGMTEAAINPLTAQLYPDDTTHRLNVLHAGFPGGSIVGGLAGYFLSAALTWQGIMALVMVPAGGTVSISEKTPLPRPLGEQSGVTRGREWGGG